MKNISPEKTTKSDTKKTILMFIVFFLISEFFIVRPLRRKFENKQNEAKKVEQVNKNTLDNNEEYVNDVIGEDILIENDYLALNINTKGLKIDDVILKKYKKNVEANDKIKLLDENYSIDVNWLSFTENVSLPNENSLWKASKIKNNMVFSYDNNEGIIFRIILSLDDKYMLNIEQVVENNKYTRLYLKPFWQISKKQAENKADLNSFNGGIGVFNNKLEEIKVKKLKNKNIEYMDFDWAGLTSKYWLTAIINNERSNGNINFLKKDNIVKMQYTTKSNMVIVKNSFVGVKNKIFIGAKDINILKEYEINSNIKLFDRSIDFGLFYFLSKPLNTLLNFFSNIVHNFGLAIILLTVIVKLILYPTVKKSFISMAKMKKAQPEMKRIQEKYKADKVGMQQELMKLYKKYDLNPLSGILPLFVQIPVFFSLYKVISVSLNMRQAPFFGYIKDLASADPTTIFNLFGLLPYDVNFKVGLLPCIMALSMYIQQKITENMQKNDSVELSEQMKATTSFMKYLPLMFLFMFSGFPAGLLLYWIFNNIITILQQIYITKRYINK